MGKERTKRFSRHVAAAGQDSKDDDLMELIPPQLLEALSSLTAPSSIASTPASTGTTNTTTTTTSTVPSLSSAAASGESNQKEEKPLNKLQKRVQKHQKFLEKLEASKGKSKKRDSQVKMSIESAISNQSPFKLKTDMLSSLLESEEDAKAKEKNKKPPKLTTASREKIIKKETQQVKAVLSHPIFKKSPLATIKEHIANSLAAEAKAAGVVEKKTTSAEKAPTRPPTGTINNHFTIKKVAKKDPLQPSYKNKSKTGKNTNKSKTGKYNTNNSNSNKGKNQQQQRSKKHK